MATDDRLPTSPPPLTPTLAPTMPWLVFVLRLSALLLALLAAACWLWASTLPLLYPAAHDAAHDLHWWSGLTLAGGLAVAALAWFAGVTRGRLGTLLVMGMLLALAAGAATFVLLVVPEPSPIHPLSLAVPYAIAGFVAAAATCLLTLASLALPMRPTAPAAGEPQQAARTSRVARLVAATTALVLICAAGWMVVARSESYVVGANEYRRGGDAGRIPSKPPTSTLTGGDGWLITVPAITVARPAVTRYGIAVSSGLNVIMIDRSTGGERWRYTRSDVTEAVTVASTGDGHHVLAWWGEQAVYVLDARTGNRVGHWPAFPGQLEILDPALPVVAREDSGRKTISRLGLTGEVRWSYSLGTCESARASLVEHVVVLVVNRPCRAPTGWTVGLDADTGRELWRTPVVGDLRGAISGAVVLLDPLGSSDVRRLAAVDLADGRQRWTRPLAGLAEVNAPCSDLQTGAGSRLVVLVCTWDATDYPLGPEKYVSTVDSYDAVNGTVRRVTYRDGRVVAAAVSADGRVIVARADATNCVLDVAGVASTTAELTLGPGYTDHHASIWTVAALDNQVIVIDAAKETLRSLR